MNWFFHKVYRTGWISMHSRRKQQLMKGATASRLWLGLWFAVFPTAKTVAAQAVAGGLVVGSYYLAREQASSPVAG